MSEPSCTICGEAWPCLGTEDTWGTLISPHDMEAAWCRRQGEPPSVEAEPLDAAHIDDLGTR